MKKTISPLLLLFVSMWLISFSACYKNDTPPYVKPDPCPWPDITTEGKHTLGFKINGKEWVPCVDIFAAVVTLRPIDALLTESDGSNALSVTGAYSVLSYGDSTMNTYGLFFRPLHKGKIQPDEIVFAGFSFSQSIDNGIFEDEWNLPELREGLNLEILKLDTAQNIIAGTFEAILIPKYGNDTLYISDGRFDLKYYPQ